MCPQQGIGIDDSRWITDIVGLQGDTSLGKLAAGQILVRCGINLFSIDVHVYRISLHSDSQHILLVQPFLDGFSWLTARLETVPLIVDAITDIVFSVLANFKKKRVSTINISEDEATTITLLNVHCSLIGKIAERSL